MRKSIKKVLSLTLAAAMTITLGYGLGTAKQTKTAKAAEAATFQGFLGFQTDTWAYRDAYDSKETGFANKTLTLFKDQPNEKKVDFDYTTMLAWANDEKADVFKITNQSDVIEKNDVEYTTSISGLDTMTNTDGKDFFTFSGSTAFKMLFVTTSIPKTVTGLKFKNVKVYYDGELKATQPDAFIKSDGTNNYMLMLVNAYGNKKKGDLPSPDISTVALPKKSITIKYTVSGLDFEAAAATPSAVDLKLNNKASNIKKLVTAGKSTTVTASRVVSPAAAAASTHEAIAYSATSANDKIAKVTSVGAPDANGNSSIKISVPKTATKGASTYVTVKCGDKIRKVKVVVKNPVKKIKATKKKVTVKKGKKVKTTFKITTYNKKKLTTDTVKVSFKKKYAKKVSVKISKTKVYVTIKGLKKKKSTTMTVKVGSKKAKMTIKTK